MRAGPAEDPTGEPSVRGKLARLKLRCVRCRRSNLDRSDSRLACSVCGATYPVTSGRLVIEEDSGRSRPDLLDRVKAPFRRFPGLYRFLVNLVSPLYFDGTQRRFVRDHIRGKEGTFVSLGSGNDVVDEAVVNVDVFAYDHVDIVSDIGRLPFQDDSVDLVMSVSVLEHVPDPQGVIEEIFRVLRPGGLVYTDVPFVVGYHASPRDFNRWTHEGVLRLHHRFETIRVVNNGGPTSALLWVFQEWVAVLLSFGSRRLHVLIYVLAMLTTFPLKFLDVALKHTPLAKHISSCFIYIGRKPGDGES